MPVSVGARGSEALPGWARGLLVAGAAVALLWLERRRPLRRPRERALRRRGRNAVMAGLAAATVRALEAPVVEPLARAVARRRLGLLQRLPLAPALRRALGVALLDYTLYAWHVLVHRVPFLWRFHRVHHVDLELEVDTAWRFHGGELALSVPFRAAQVAALGIDPGTLHLWQTLTMLSILFHHANVRLPARVERVVSAVVVTPRLHTIHHSLAPEEVSSNWSSGLTVWDWLHGTLRRDPPPEQVEVGVPDPRDPAQARLGRILAMPFLHQPPAWRPPDAPLRVEAPARLLP